MPYVRCPSCEVAFFSPLSARTESECPNCAAPVEALRAGEAAALIAQDRTDRPENPPDRPGERATAARKELRRIDDAAPQEDSD